LQTMIELIMESFIKELQQIKEQQKELADRESLVKALLKESMEQEGIDKQETDYGTVYAQRRSQKEYSSAIMAMETQLKEAKKLADDLGDYTIVSTKESLVFNLPKELF
jgi:hypothetical protein